MQVRNTFPRPTGPETRMAKLVPFIERFGLWNADQTRRARELKALVVKNKLKLANAD